MIDPYTIINILTTSVLFLCLGLLLLFLDIPDSPLLGNYRRARKMMAGAYLFFAGVSIAEFLFSDVSYGTSVRMLQTIFLAIAVSQALLFTLALMALLEVRFPGRRFIIREALPVVLFIGAIFAVYAVASDCVFAVAFYLFSGLYALLLWRYTRMFLACYRQFHAKMDNYFSDYEAERMRWVIFSFFAALTIGVMALMTAIFVSTLVAVLFAVVFNIFYFWFAIRFINYGSRFYTIENALDDNTENEIEPICSQTADEDSQLPQSSIFLALEKKIEQWVADKLFNDKTVTIATLSKQLTTNRSYISSYINTCKGKSFREWIAELRIEEAKNLMRQQQDMSVKQVAEKVGFADKSNFIRLFTKLTGDLPSEWKKKWADCS